jgi:hypothetical protein
MLPIGQRLWEPHLLTHVRACWPRPRQRRQEQRANPGLAPFTATVWKDRQQCLPKTSRTGPQLHQETSSPWHPSSSAFADFAKINRVYASAKSARGSNCDVAATVYRERTRARAACRTCIDERWRCRVMLIVS